MRQNSEELRNACVNEDVTLLAPRTGGNENTGLIKACAILFMIVDHVSAAFFPSILEMRVIGRIAMPLFCWCICVGAEYTRNIWKYALRLLLVGILAQPCYMQGLHHSWNELNVYATLLCGLLGIASIRENRFGSRYWGPALAILIPCAVKMDYGWQGVAFILLLYGCRKQTSAIAALMVAFCLYWGNGTITLTKAFGIPALQSISFLPHTGGMLRDLSRIQFWAVLALPLIIIPMGRGFRMPKWLGYAAYPGHLLVLGVIRHWDAIMQFIHRLA